MSNRGDQHRNEQWRFSNVGGGESTANRGNRIDSIAGMSWGIGWMIAALSSRELTRLTGMGGAKFPRTFRNGQCDVGGQVGETPVAVVSR